MITVSKDNLKIYLLLERNEKLFVDFTTDKALIFDIKDDCYVILFSSCSGNFTQFKAESYLHKSDSLTSLLEAMQDFSDEDFPVSLVNDGIRLVENKFNSDNTRFYFDAH
jgi:hypothetical protein